jgi:hypothetical protein
MDVMIAFICGVCGESMKVKPRAVPPGIGPAFEPCRHFSQYDK